MTFEIPAGNWASALADAIEASRDGDVIKMRTLSQAELGENVRLRMCPGKSLHFEWAVDDLADWDEDDD